MKKAIPIFNRPGSYFYVNESVYEEALEFNWVINEEGVIFIEGSRVTIENWLLEVKK